MVYKNLASYFKTKYGKRLSKICIDGGFSCPNRDGTCGVGGCIYCGERGAGEHIDPTVDIGEQVRRALAERSADEMFVAYFQNFTNTYAPTSVLKERYDAALIDDRIKVLAIGTRPDCITTDICELIASYRKRCDVWVELGLQTANDKTAELIRRGYKTEVFDKAVKMLGEYGIDVVVHIIIGLPNENFEDVSNTVAFLNRYKLFGIKIHSIYVMHGTELEKMYLNGIFTPLSQDAYTDMAAYVVKNINEGTVIHRLTGDCPRDMLVAPEWNKNKNQLINEIRKKLSEQL